MRTFVAVEVPETTRVRIVALQQRLEAEMAQAQVGGCIRWTAAANLHLTLRFLGDTTAEQVRQVQVALAAAATVSTPLALAVGGLGCFPHFRRPKIVWLALSGEVTPLTALQERCERAAHNAGFAPEERPFTPHLTIGRAQRNATPAQLQRCGECLQRLAPTWESSGAQAATCAVDRVVLMESDLHPSGPVYSPLGAYPLGKRG